MPQHQSRSGNTSNYAAPGDMYRVAAKRFASIAESTQSICVRLCAALELSDLPHDARCASNPQRVANLAALDTIISAAIGTYTLDELCRHFDASPTGMPPTLSHSLRNQRNSMSRRRSTPFHIIF
jgi:crotonobetainyl-CoA:carnitine CoA-transferase CaiB-like acyl-CoA transferase